MNQAPTLDYLVLARITEHDGKCKQYYTPASKTRPCDMEKPMRPITLFILLVTTLWSNALCASDFPVYELMVRITPETYALEGRAKITLPEHAKVRIVSEKLTLKKLHIDGKEYRPLLKESLKGIEIPAGGKTIEIEYSARFEAALPKGNIKNEGVIDTNAINSSGVMLLSGWYPDLSMRCRYQLTVEIPKDFEPISESDAVIVSHDGPNKNVQFRFSHPTPGITLVAGKYHVTEKALRIAPRAVPLQKIFCGRKHLPNRVLFSNLYPPWLKGTKAPLHCKDLFGA